jgi:hypothetical protein
VFSNPSHALLRSPLRAWERRPRAVGMALPLRIARGRHPLIRNFVSELGAGRRCVQGNYSHEVANGEEGRAGGAGELDAAGRRVVKASFQSLDLDMTIESSDQPERADPRLSAASAQLAVLSAPSRATSTPAGRLVDGPCPLGHASGRGASPDF